MSNNQPLSRLKRNQWEACKRHPSFPNECGKIWKERGIAFSQSPALPVKEPTPPELLAGPYQLDGYNVWFNRDYYERGHICIQQFRVCYHVKGLLITRLPRFSDEQMWAVYDAVERNRREVGKRDFLSIAEDLNLTEREVRTRYDRAHAFVYSYEQEQTQNHEQEKNRPTQSRAIIR